MHKPQLNIEGDLMSLSHCLAANPDSNYLADRTGKVTYAELQREFARLDQLWQQAGNLKARGTVVLVSRDDLGSAIAALYLLTNRHSCYFWRPPTPEPDHLLPWSDFPDFCGTALLPRTTTENNLAFDYELSCRSPVWSGVNAAASNYIYLGTSGTTARPKLATYTPERMIGNAENCVQRLQITSEDRVLLPMPLAHMYGLGAAFLPSVLAGASIYLLRNVNVLTYFQAEQEFDPTVVFLTPGLAHQLVTARRQKRPYRLTVLGTDRIDADTFARYEELHGCTICIYGSTETGALAASSPDDPFSRRQSTSGRLLNQVRLLSNVAGVASETGDLSETLCFEYPLGMSGYADDSGQPRRPSGMSCDDIYLTRDVGEIDENGDLRVFGRRDDRVKRDGFLVAFGDIERALEQVPGIARGIVCSGEPTPRGVALTAFCVPHPNASPDPAEVQRHCHQLLAPYAIPDRFVILDQIPLTANGKPDRQVLKSMMAQF